MARVRRSAEQTRELMLDAGVSMLQRDGIDIGVEDLTLEAICTEEGIARSSSHAAWAINDDFSPQETFQRAVLKRWLEESEGTLFAAAANEAILDTLGKDANASALAIQRASEAAYLEGLKRYDEGDGDFISTDMAMRFALASQSEQGRDPEIFKWIQDSEQRNREEKVRDLYKPMGELIGMEPKPEVGEDAYQFYAMVVAALLEGFTLRHYLSPELDCLSTIGPSSRGDFDESVIGACIQAMIPVFFQPVEGND